LTYTQQTVSADTWNSSRWGGCGSPPHRQRAPKIDSIKAVRSDRLGRLVFNQRPMSNYNTTSTN